MKKTGLFLTVIMMSLIIVSCAKQRKEEEPYNRTGSVQEIENRYRNKVFAPTSGEGHFYATYAMGEIAKEADSEGYYKVKFTNGSMKGKTIKTRDVILKTEYLTPGEITKGMVVLRDFYNPGSGRATNYDRWNKAVVYDVTQLKNNKVVIEFPHDRNDFLATRETVHPGSLRLVTAPAQQARDPRTFLP